MPPENSRGSLTADWLKHTMPNPVETTERLRTETTVARLLSTALIFFYILSLDSAAGLQIQKR